MSDTIHQSKYGRLIFMIKLALAVIILPPVCAFAAYYEAAAVWLLLLPNATHEPFVLAVAALTVLQYILGLALIILAEINLRQWLYVFFALIAFPLLLRVILHVICLVFYFS